MNESDASSIESTSSECWWGVIVVAVGSDTSAQEGQACGPETDESAKPFPANLGHEGPSAPSPDFCTHARLSADIGEGWSDVPATVAHVEEHAFLCAAPTACEGQSCADIRGARRQALYIVYSG